MLRSHIQLKYGFIKGFEEPQDSCSLELPEQKKVTTLKLPAQGENAFWHGRLRTKLQTQCISSLFTSITGLMLPRIHRATQLLTPSIHLLFSLVTRPTTPFLYPRPSCYLILPWLHAELSLCHSDL